MSTLLIMVSILIVGAIAFAEDKALGVTTNKAVVDGTIGDGEYSFSQDFGQLTLHLNRSSDTVWIGIVGTTSGWVAVGLGSLRMDQATIFMGFVGSDGKVQFKPQAGSSHSHLDTTKDVENTITAFKMKEAGGKTTLELALKADAYILKGQDALDLIFALGSQDSFSPRHTYRNYLKVKLAS